MTVTQRIKEICFKYPDRPALQVKDSNGVFQPYLYKTFYKDVSAVGAALASGLVSRGDHIGIISDNRKEWIITDLAILGIGAVDVPRGSDSTEAEIVHILSHSESRMVFMETFRKASLLLESKDKLPLLECVVIFNPITDDEFEKLAGYGVKVVRFDDILKKGREILASDPEAFERELAKGQITDLATIIYTSGTTGIPKGVMLNHESFIFQIDRILYKYLQVKPGHTLLSMLPIWHAFERTVEYIVFFVGANVAYSQPIGAVLMNDIQKTRAQWLSSVPRVWDGIRSAVIRAINKSGKFKRVMFSVALEVGIMYQKSLSCLLGTMPQYTESKNILDIIIGLLGLPLLFPLYILSNIFVFRKFKKFLGGRFVAGISGGGSLSSATRRFFKGMSIKILEGYGLTEAGPILSVCRQKRPVYGTVGPILPDVQFKIMGPDNKEITSPGTKGILWVKSPQIMQGYYKQEEATAKVLKDGWLDTGDIVVSTLHHEIRIVGRAKETIVLRGGENIEPVPIENACMQSEYVDQIVVLGQDQKFIAALIVPNFKNIEEKSKEMGISYMDMEDLLANPQVYSMVYSNINDIVSTKNGFKNYEKIFRIYLLSKPFTVGDELTNSLKVKRDVVNRKYKSQIAKLFK
ncbi:MAG: AMP-binding protein [Spirochaetia bacterium]|nr:AMP-binding protein [Spirochaetia bacterium]